VVESLRVGEVFLFQVTQPLIVRGDRCFAFQRMRRGPEHSRDLLERLVRRILATPFQRA
jgi:hypothetical protein